MTSSSLAKNYATVFDYDVQNTVSYHLLSYKISHCLIDNYVSTSVTAVFWVSISNSCSISDLYHVVTSFVIIFLTPLNVLMSLVFGFVCVFWIRNI